LLLKKFIVFLDSNIYDAANYSFGNPQFSKLSELIYQDHVTLLINSVVEGEVKKHIKERIKKAANEFNKLVSSREFASFRYEEEYADKIAKLEPNEMYTIPQKRFDEYLESCKAVSIPVNGINIEQVINDYVEGKYPFEASKPAEFKDAIIIQSLLEYQKLNNEQKIYIVTNDKGFRAALNNKENHTCKDINEFLELVTESIDDLVGKLNSYLINEEMISEIEAEIRSSINDTTYSMDLPYDEFDVIDIENIKFDVAFIDIISSSEAKVIIDAEADIKIWFSYTDEDKSYFDKEDWEYLWKVEVEKEEVHRIAFELTLNIDIEKFSDDIAHEDLEVIVEGHEDGPSRIDLNEATFVSGEVVSDNYRDDEDDYSSGSGVCPDCGEKLTFETDALTGFCTTCSPNH
jgi:hypothetical protein